MITSNKETFKLCSFKYYRGANPYLNTGALVFQFSVIGNPLAIEDYREKIEKKISLGEQINSYIELFAQTVSQVNKLEMELHPEKYHVQKEHIAIQCLDYDTTVGVVNLVWDWWEAITRNRDFNLESRIRHLQEEFRLSPYGGPTSYALLKSAYTKGIPTFYLPEERLMQYGYGKHQVRGISTTFDCDSHLDSDFTTQKDECKDFLAQSGFPVPEGKVIYTLAQALGAAAAIGYPVAVKPVAGHKGIGVTANINNEQALKFAFEKAVEATPHKQGDIIVEKYIPGNDFRLLCVGGKFVAALERLPPFIIGDSKSTIKELIDKENATEARQDTPTSPLAAIIVDEVMENYLEQQGLQLNSIPKTEEVIYLRQVANISSGGVSVDVTRSIHPDNIILANEIAEYFRLVCLGIDVITKDLSHSWKDGEFGIIEINAAPGVYMHMKPAIGDSIDVPSQILDYLAPKRIPIITFNHLSEKTVFEIIEPILMSNPLLKIGVVCRQGVWLNHVAKNPQRDYNANVEKLLRHPKLDLLMAEYSGDIFEQEGMLYEGSDIVILEEPRETEMLLTRDLLPNGTLIIKRGHEVSLESKQGKEFYRLTNMDAVSDIYVRTISNHLRRMG